MNKEGMNELKKLFEQKKKKENNNSSSKNKKKETKEDKKKQEKQEKQEKLKKENNKQDFSQRSHTLTGSELEAVRNSLVKNPNKNDKNVKASNKEPPMNELDKIKSNLARKSVILTSNIDIKMDNNGGVKNAIQNFNKAVNDNKDNKKETNKAKNIISNINKDNNKNGNNKDEKNETKSVKANIANINNKNGSNKDEKNETKSVKTNINNINDKNGSNKDEKNEDKNVKTNVTNINNIENKNNIPKCRTETVIDPGTIKSVLKDNGKMDDIKSLIKTNNKTINENEKKVYEKTFDRFVSLQTLLKKESSLKELCK